MLIIYCKLCQLSFKLPNSRPLGLQFGILSSLAALNRFQRRLSINAQLLAFIFHVPKTLSQRLVLNPLLHCCFLESCKTLYGLVNTGSAFASELVKQFRYLCIIICFPLLKLLIRLLQLLYLLLESKILLIQIEELLMQLVN